MALRKQALPDQMPSLHSSSPPLVSVVIPAYRHQDYIIPAINSLLAQTFQDWEAIIIDDASPDATWESIKSIRDDRMRCYRHTINLGAHRTINEGIAMARGQFIAILNSDDTYMPRRLERLVALIEEQGADLVSTDLSLITSQGIMISDPSHWWLQWYNALKAQFVQTKDLTATLFDGNLFITTSNFFLRREVLDKIGLFADFRYVHDYEFIFRLLANDYSVHFAANETLLSYRLHGANTILEDRWAAARETLDLLLFWHPKLTAPSCKQLAAAATGQLRRVYGYIEQEYAAQRKREANHAKSEIARITTKLSKAKSQVMADLSLARSTISEQQAQIDALRTRCEQLDAQLQERDVQLHNRNDLITQQTERLLTLGIEKQELSMKQVVMLRQLASVSSERDALQRSRSFRLGNAVLRPLSRIRQWLPH
jgi:glycosyltransferase involved in cell wall biosynthesis